MRSSLRRIPRAVAGVAVLAAGLSAAGAAPAMAAAAPAAVHTQAAPAPGPVSGPITHPDADHMGSTIRSNEPTSPPTAASRTGQVTASAVANQPRGLDVSGYQPTIDWNAVAANGARFAYVKATEGTGYTSPQFGNQYTGSYRAGLIRGAYHFGLPDRASGAAQANFFVNNGGAWSGDGATLPPMLDIEYNPYGPTCYGLTGGQMAGWIRDFSATVNARTGRYPTIYTTRGWWNQCTSSDPTFGSTNPLFLANYSTSPGAMPAGWAYQSIWQYADSGVFPGDQDVFNGDLNALRSFAGLPPTAIDQHYTALGGANSFLGAPTDTEHPVPGGAVRDYQGGSVYWSAGTGAHEVHGAIRDHYAALGGPAGVLGYPTSDELTTRDGVGRFGTFTGNGAGASIYWTPSGGAWSVRGAIRDHWAALGYETGPMGYPSTDEAGTPDGVGRFTHFTGNGAGASIYWTPSGGAWSVQGAIRSAWAGLGWERSSLGYPTSDEFAVPGGRASTFAHGTLTFTYATGQVTRR